jgi:thiamine biosynthesis protein ThiS
MSETTVMVRINGEEHEVPQEITLGSLVERLGFNPALVAVEKNGQVVPRSEIDSTSVSSGDDLEIVEFVGGG